MYKQKASKRGNFFFHSGTLQFLHSRYFTVGKISKHFCFLIFCEFFSFVFFIFPYNCVFLFMFAFLFFPEDRKSYLLFIRNLIGCVYAMDVKLCSNEMCRVSIQMSEYPEFLSLK